jgi:hypothetical protein
VSREPISPQPAPVAGVRPGSRVDRMARPLVRDVLREIAERHGVCTRPLVVRRIERDTGRIVGFVEVPCGARLASKCKPCAERNRRLRQRQIREGWHLTEEPVVVPEKPAAEVVALLHQRADLLFDRERAVLAQDWSLVDALDAAIDQVDEQLAGQRIRGGLHKPGEERKPRTVRSTRRRTDVPELPRRRVENRSIGRVYIGRGGKQHRPSMLLTPTLPSFGPVHSGKRMRRGQLIPCECGRLHGERDPLLGTPLDPDTYDYRGHALALIFFPRVLDRFWQNYRRAVGWKIAYAGVVEMQRRLATHAHFAVRGTIPRRLTRQVAAATYHQVWWPAFDTPVYDLERPPVWNEQQQAYVDPHTGTPLVTWRQAIATLTEPAYVARLGSVDVRGMEAGTRAADRAIKYATKYLTKDLVDHTFVKSEAQRAHHERLRQELAVLPCSSRCANWLLYGVQPEGAKRGLVPGACRGKVHQPATLGYTGRRCLISRNWSNKTLTDHRLDGRDWLRAIAAGLLDDQQHPEHDHGRYIYELANQHDRDIPPLQQRIFRSIAARLRIRQALNAAGVGQRAGPVSATQPSPALAMAGRP